jgi:hypothetical protein
MLNEQELNMIVEAEPGQSIWQAVKMAKESASQISNGEVVLMFNDIALRVNEDSVDSDIVEIYRLSMLVERLKKGYRE